MIIKDRFTGDIKLEGNYNSISEAIADNILNDLTDLDLQGAIFKDSDLSYLDFSRCNLSNADFTNCNLYSTKFNGCMLTNAKLRYSILRYCDFTLADLTNTDLRDTDLSYSIIIGANTKGTDFRYSNLYEAKLSTDIIYLYFISDETVILNTESKEIRISDICYPLDYFVVNYKVIAKNHNIDIEQTERCCDYITNQQQIGCIKI